MTEHDVAAFVDVLAASAGEAGRWIHFGLTSSDVLDTALALQLRAAGEVIVAGARALDGGARARARASTRSTLCVGRTHGVHAEPTTLRHQARRLRVRGAPQRRAPASARSRRSPSGALSGAVGTYAATSPEFEARVLAPPRACARGRLHAGRPPRPPRRAARRDRARRRRPRAPRDRGPPPAAHRGARGCRSRSAPARRAPRRCRTSATRSRASRSPGSRACCAATPRRRSRTSPCGTSATSPTPPSSA